MIFGFLLAFAAGFLMTAIPRMSGAKPASFSEILIAAILALLQPLAVVVDAVGVAGAAIAFFQFLALSVFIARRLLGSRVSPPPSFVFLPFALLIGLIGALLLWVRPETSFPVDAISRILLYKGFMMCFVLGVGARLLPVFLRGAEPPSSLPVRAPARAYFINVLLALLYLLALLVEGFFPRPANLTQLGIIGFLCVTQLHIHHLPLRRGVQPWGIWISLWSLIVGQAWLGFFPATAIHGVHLIYISGWGLLTFLVGTRVVLAHGGSSLQVEMTSKVLGFAIGLWVLAGATRASLLLFQEDHYWSHASYSVVCWVVGIILWLVLTRKFLFRNVNAEKKDC